VSRGAETAEATDIAVAGGLLFSGLFRGDSWGGGIGGARLSLPVRLEELMRNRRKEVSENGRVNREEKASYKR